MTTKYSTTTTLIIVESPAKCKKIEEYLGPGYKCLATYGHLRELNSLNNIDIQNKFTPTYTIINNAIKKKQIEILRKEIKNAYEVILALDGDREGEKISYCVAQIFNLDINKTKRITFNEITESALRNAINNPRTVDMNLVHAQQARQILDLLVGFKISPILWKCIKKDKDNALSAGRCQTPALKLIYDNEQEIKNSVIKRVYNTTGYFTNSNLPFELNKQYETEDELTDFLHGSISYKHIYSCSSPTKIIKSGPEPFTTSTLQQKASNELHYSPKETMKICQTLYEAGYITYMRTDSKKYSTEFIENAKTYIISSYDARYINPIYNTDKSDIIDTTISKKKTTKKSVKLDKKEQPKNNLVQEAHEAIRPTNIALTELPDEMKSSERRMYKLIWSNTLESCMADATFFKVVATISAFQNNKFTYSSEQIDFPGWLAVQKKYQEVNTTYQYLQIIKQNSLIPYKKMISKVSIKGSKSHYTEARLVQLLEEKGIGRPSTFSSLIDKIQERGYVKKEDVKGVKLVCNEYELENDEISEIQSVVEYGNEKSKLVIQPLGTIVIEFLDQYFSELFNYDYTKDMEDQLDKIAKGDQVWHELCSICNLQVETLMSSLSEKGLDVKLEIKLDEQNTYLIGKYGPVIKHVEETKEGKEIVSFKPIRPDVDINMDKLKNGEYNMEEIIKTDKTDKPDKISSIILGQYEGDDVVLKKGKFGLYISWGKNSKTLKELGNRPIENVTFDEVKKYLEEGSPIIREISTALSIRKGPKGDYLFYKTAKMKKPQFYDIKCFLIDNKDEDYKKCNIDILKSWIKDKYNI
jgi:DNA topoisomerase-1